MRASRRGKEEARGQVSGQIQGNRFKQEIRVMTKVEAESYEKSAEEIEKAIDAYVNGRASLGGAAEIAGISYCDFREELRKRGLLSKRKIGLT